MQPFEESDESRSLGAERAAKAAAEDCRDDCPHLQLGLAWQHQSDSRIFLRTRQFAHFCLNCQCLPTCESKPDMIWFDHALVFFFYLPMRLSRSWGDHVDMPQVFSGAA